MLVCGLIELGALQPMAPIRFAQYVLGCNKMFNEEIQYDLS